MTSPSHLQYNLCYHIYNRGVNRTNIFIEEKNYDYFMKMYVKYIPPVADTFAYCLLRNHFHLLVRIKSREEMEREHAHGVEETPWASQQFSNFFNAYAKSINKAYARTGSLFQHPFGRGIVHTDAHFLRAIRYIHQNPQKHGLVRDFRDWPHSSYRVFLDSTPAFVRRAEVLEWFGGVDGFARLHGENLEHAVFGLDEDE